ncbi:hypothetical protein LOM8899_04025 [Flavimaricola marinus]|uniref:Uncharacterized protein n=1 Tax=Flavimaricola marinus TaxID=1819565 RepID=A0A238LJY5_9RHOB|nr:hypothetical protein LOM8899_04025 [Flavimaricola marinus]
MGSEAVVLRLTFQIGYAEIVALILRAFCGVCRCLAEIVPYNLRKECVKYDLHSRTP